MLKPYLCVREYKIDDGEWDILFTCVALLEEDGSNYHPRFREETTLTFDEVWNSAQEFHSIYAGRTFFRKRRVLYIRSDKHIEPTQVLDMQCNKISFRDTRKEAPYTTLAYLMKHSPSDLVVRYIKENGLAVCPLK